MSTYHERRHYSFTSASFIYDGDGKRVKSVMNMSNGTTTTYFVGAHYEVANGVVTKYYYAGSQRIALRANGMLNYLLGDHLGSTSLTTDANGNVISEMRYKAWGETRYASGSTPTKYTYTGQYSYVSDFGLHFYNARWYDSSLSRFAQADTIIPQNQGVQAWDRYIYTNNNPVRYNDPSGHCTGNSQDPQNADSACWMLLQEIENTYNVKVDSKNFTVEELKIVDEALYGISNVMGQEKTSTMLDGWTIRNKKWGFGEWFCGKGCTNPIGKTITLYDSLLDNEETDVAKLDVIHEIGHVFDSSEDINNPKNLGDFKDKFWSGCTRYFAKCLPFGQGFEGVKGTPASEHARKNSAEDFAETFASYIWMKNSWEWDQIGSVFQPIDPDRWDYMDKEVHMR